MTDIYKLEESVIVILPGGIFTGKVKKILPNYAWGEETRYEVSGKGFETICSARSMRKNGRLF